MGPDAERMAERAAQGVDRYDEVWDGRLRIVPLPDLEHQEIVATLTYIFKATLVVCSASSSHLFRPLTTCAALRLLEVSH